MESEQFRWIGKSLPRVEDERLMRGAGRYIDDLEPFPGCKAAAIVRSPYAHAHIRHIDVEAAFQVPGVVGVITGAAIANAVAECPRCRAYRLAPLSHTCMGFALPEECSYWTAEKRGVT